ncbi:MAG TPA: diguanylate cyclase, partial [Solirubrobacteraceae bacterium]|nr:diguanylate cyclase [Solirubrobacteraceae bacterium]
MGTSKIAHDGHPSAAQRLSLVVEAQREILASDGDLATAARLIAERSQAIIGADGAMVNLLETDVMHTVGASGSAAGVVGMRRALAGSVARFAIAKRRSLLIEDCPNDPRIDQSMRATIGDTSLICVPLMRAGEAIGTLNVMRSDPARPLTGDDLETLEMLSVVMTSVVARVREDEARRDEATAVRRLRTLFDGASIGILRLDCDGVVVEVNPEMARMLGSGVGEICGRPFTELVAAADRAAFASMLEELVGGRRSSFELELRCAHASGAETWVLLRGVGEHGGECARGSVVAMAENISERKRAERELLAQSQLNAHQALHDHLTGLPNRILFGERVAQAIRQAQRSNTRVAVALIDLDRFKEVNDSLGHGAGDELLVSVGKRMVGALRASDTVARFGGDEFALLLPRFSRADEVLPALERLRLALEQPVALRSLPIGVEASIGIALYPDHGRDAQSLIQHADVAMYQAKRDGATFCFYDPDSQGADLGKLTLVADLRRAIAQQELVLHYQPKAALASGEVRSVEALLRWAHPQRGMVAPDSFIPLAQETSLIGPLTLHVVERALEQVRAWRRQGIELSVAVNLSTRNLLDRDLPRQVAELLERHGVEAASLELEVTESSMLENPARAREVMGEL